MLIDEEFVAGRGSVAVVWLVERNRGWMRAASAPGARSERLAAGPGTVWRSRIEIELARGTRLVRVETRPGARSASTLEHLVGSRARSTRRVTRTPYRVARAGALAPDPPVPKRTK